MKRNILLSLLSLIVIFVFISCGNSSHIDDETALAVLGYAGYTDSTSLDSRAISFSSDTTITMTDVLVTYEDVEYTLAGSYLMTWRSFGDLESGFSYEYSMDGTISIASNGQISEYDVDLTYTTSIEIDLTAGTYTYTMTATGNVGGQSVDEILTVNF